MCRVVRKAARRASLDQCVAAGFAGGGGAGGLSEFQMSRMIRHLPSFLATTVTYFPASTVAPDLSVTVNVFQIHPRSPETPSVDRRAGDQGEPAALGVRDVLPEGFADRGRAACVRRSRRVDHRVVRVERGDRGRVARGVGGEPGRIDRAERRLIGGSVGLGASGRGSSGVPHATSRVRPQALMNCLIEPPGWEWDCRPISGMGRTYGQVRRGANRGGRGPA